MDNIRFVSIIAYLLAGMIVWAAAFTVAYTAAAVVCARRLGGMAVMGIGLLPFTVAVTTVVALGATGAIAMMAYRRWPRDAGRDDHRQRNFVHTLALMVALMAVVGIVWNGLPALFFDTCA